MLDLNAVTLVTIDGVGHDVDAVKALKYSTKNINFNKILYITAGEMTPNFCSTVKISKLSRDDYQKFCVVELANYINTEYFLLIQSDGFVVNPHSWDERFLNYDYVGAPWPNSTLARALNNPLVRKIDEETSLVLKNATGLVGNGGFTLRSKRLLDISSKLFKEEYIGTPEDNVICILMRRELENSGIKFPDYRTALQFSCEHRIFNNILYSSDHSFGFHCRSTHLDKIRLLESININEIL